MRLDLFLRLTGVFKTRTIAARACKSGFVTLNDAPSRASAEVRQGDRIGAVRPDGALQSYRVLKVPSTSQIPKKERGDYIAEASPDGDPC